MVSDFRRRFWICLALTIPVVLLSPMIQRRLGIGRLAFAGQDLVQLVFATIVFFYGGWPFLSGLFSELSRRRPGMMTLIGLATSVAYFYSTAVVFGVPGEGFYWELATLIDIMLLGHWVEMRSVMGASRALEELEQRREVRQGPHKKVHGRNATSNTVRTVVEEAQFDASPPMRE